MGLACLVYAGGWLFCLISRLVCTVASEPLPYLAGEMTRNCGIMPRRWGAWMPAGQREPARVASGFLGGPVLAETP